MAVNAYLMIDGIDGPSTSRPKAIDILDFNVGATMTTTYGGGASGHEARAGSADVSDVSITKVTDKTSPFLFDHCVSGNVIPKVSIFYGKAVGDKQEDFYKIELQDVLVTQFRTNGRKEVPMESVSFAYQKITVAYAAENDDGSVGSFVPKGFDRATLRPC